MTKVVDWISVPGDQSDNCFSAAAQEQHRLHNSNDHGVLRWYVILTPSSSREHNFPTVGTGLSLLWTHHNTGALATTPCPTSK